jgi:hypothetical protein
MKKICFFNHGHNGDIFSAKGWIQYLQKQLPDYEFFYTHLENTKVMLDLNFEYFDHNQVPEHVRNMKVAVHNDIIYVNTWLWYYTNEVFVPGQVHGNWYTFLKMWNIIIQNLKDLGLPVRKSQNPLDGIPSTNWNFYVTKPVDDFVKKYQNSKIHIFGNGPVRSGQSGLTDMKFCLEELARRFSSDVFVATYKFDSRLKNIFFSDDIFHLQNDINEIAYLSTHASVVVGKNGGPFLFCHVRENVFDADKTFVGLTQRASDSYPWNTAGYRFNFYHSASENQDFLVEKLSEILRNNQNKFKIF